MISTTNSLAPQGFYQRKTQACIVKIYRVLTTETQFQREKNIAVLWTDFVDIRREIKSVFTSHIAFIQVKVQTGWTQIWYMKKKQPKKINF